MKAPPARVGIVVPSLFDTGGVISVVTFLQRAIRGAPDFEMRLFSLATSSSDASSVLLRKPSTWPRGPRTVVGEFNGDPFVHFGATLAEFEFRRYSARPALHRCLAECDLVQVVAGAPAWVLPVIGCGKPIVLQVATLAKVERKSLHSATRTPVDVWRRLMTHVTARYDEIGLRAAAAIMVENPWMLDYARAATRSLGTIVRYAPPGVDVSLFSPAADRVAVLSGKPYVLAVGRFADPRKNGTLLLEAFSHALRRLDQPLNLVVAGADDPGDAFRAKANALGIAGRMTIRTKLSDHELAETYRGASCLVLSSNEEGLGIVVLEAMASGIPVVATRCGGPNGVITDGVDGFLVPIGDAQAMANRLTSVINDRSVNIRIGEKARGTIEAHYAEKVAGAAFLDLYRSLLYPLGNACAA